MADAGWYPDASDPDSLLYWDGERWTGDRRPVSPLSAGSSAGGSSSDADTGRVESGATDRSGTPSSASDQSASSASSEAGGAEGGAAEPADVTRAISRPSEEQLRSWQSPQAQRPESAGTSTPDPASTSSSWSPGSAPAEQQSWSPSPQAADQQTQQNQQSWAAPAQQQPWSQGAPSSQSGAQQWDSQGGYGAPAAAPGWPGAGAPSQAEYGATPQGGYGGAPGAGYGGTPQAGYGGSPDAGTQRWSGGITPPPPKKKRTGLYIAAGVVVLLVAGLITFLVWPSSDAPKFTYQGKALASADTTLKTAESTVSALVSKRHGAKNADTRCYFAQQTKPASGQKKSDVASSLRCGPVLFVDGDAAQTYLPVTTTSASAKGGKVELTPQSLSAGAEPAAVPTGVTLARPDGKKAPDGAGGLKVPSPPAAESDVLTTAELGPTSPPKSLDNAVMVGKNTKVTITAAGEISRYGSGEDARSAPSGEKLMAFKVVYGAGDESGGGSARAALVVGGQSRTLPEADSGQWIIAAVPSSGTPVISLVDGGVTQTLSLPDGTPGANNLAVLTRTHRSQFLFKSFDVSLKASRGGNSVNITWRARVTLASLDYWPPRHDTVHASSPKNALLSFNPTYSVVGESGGPYGLDTHYIVLKLPSGQTVRARNIAESDRVFNVFEVPASFTKGTFVISGSQKFSDGITVRVTKDVNIAVSIPAG